jgi:hypothetical protein
VTDWDGADERRMTWELYLQVKVTRSRLMPRVRVWSGILGKCGVTGCCDAFGFVILFASSALWDGERSSGIMDRSMHRFMNSDRLVRDK